MPVLCLGISHQTAPVAVREALAYDRDTVLRVLTEWDRDRAWAAGIGEIVLISTCNRTEVYLASRGPAEHFTAVPELAEAFLLAGLAEQRREIRRHIYTHTGAGAVAHLCRVAAGLDSMVVGESEVLGQVVAAHGLAADAGTTGLMLDAAFRAAIRAGRRARAETAIGRSATSIASEGVRVLEAELRARTDRRVLVVGTGAMARLVGEIVVRRLQVPPTIVGRNRRRAEAVSQAVRGTAASWNELPGLLSDADGVISLTTAPGPVLTTAMVQDAVRRRRNPAPLLCLDLAVPRDVEPAVRGVDGVQLLDLDDLKTRMQANRRSREAERPRVEAIIEQEVTQFQAWLQGAEMRPVLSAMHARGEEIRQREMKHFLRRHPDADPELREELDRLSRSIVAKLLHGPSARLRTETDPGQCRRYASALQQLFGLGDNGTGRPAGTA
jgi:glutamyl-tRNA reductase